MHQQEEADAGEQLLRSSLIWYIRKLYSMGGKEQVLKIFERVPKDAQEFVRSLREELAQKSEEPDDTEKP